MIGIRLALTLLLASFFIGGSLFLGESPALGISIPIVNPSFEDDALADGASTSDASGWSETSGGGDGVLDPVAADFPGGIPDGENVGYVNLPGNYLYQELDAVLAPGLEYTLTASVGRRVGQPFAGYQVQLLAGGAVLAEVDSSDILDGGQFITVFTTFKAGPEETALGDPLAVQLLSKGSQTVFDAIRLEARPCCVQRPYAMTAWWPLDEPGPSNAADIVGANDGTHVNGPAPTPGKVAGALSFDGSDDFVRVPDHPSLDFGIGDFSVDAWVRTTDDVGVDTLVDKRTSNAIGTRGWHLYLFNGDLGFQLADRDGSNICSSDNTTSSCTNWVVGSGGFVADGAWHHVAVTIDRDDPAGLVFYVDGVAVDSFDPTIRNGNLDNAGELRMGVRSIELAGYYAGTLDEVELFARRLGPSEIQALYQADRWGKCKTRISMDWDTPICLNADTSRPTSIEVCNDATTDRDFELTFVPVPAGDCQIDGPTAFNLLAPPLTPVPPAASLAVGARTCESVPFEIVRPVDMTSNGLIACFDAVLTDTSNGEEMRKRSSVQDWRECCSTGPAPGVTEVPIGGNAEVLFQVVNTSGGPLVFDYRVESMPPDGGPGDSLLSLAGQAPGTPVTGKVTFADQEVIDIRFPVNFFAETGLLTEDVILEVDTGAGYQALVATRVRSQLATETFDDGFETGDTSTWSNTVPQP